MGLRMNTVEYVILMKIAEYFMKTTEYRGLCTVVYALRFMHYGLCTTVYALRFMHCGLCAAVYVIQVNFARGGKVVYATLLSMVYVEYSARMRKGEVNPTHAYYNGSRTSKDTERSKLEYKYQDRKTQMSSSALEAL
ncbi:hypothetical protein Tco_0669962 [Tanacetum coccineum]